MDRDSYPRCKTCKWWGFEETSETRMRRSKTMKLCGSEKIVNMPLLEDGDRQKDERGDYLFESDEAAHYDGSDYLSEFVTGPDFGCIHHEP